MSQEDDNFYHNLSRKELQTLCKEHGLPANKSHSHLAKLLASYYQKNVNSTPSEQRSSGPTDVFPFTSPVSDLKSQSQLDPIGGTNNGVIETSAKAPNVDNCGPSCFKEVPGSIAKVALRHTSNSGTAEGFGCSNYDIQGHTSRSLFGSQCEDNGLKLKRKEPSKSMELPPTSFQFYVRSEEGIKLCVDLNSSPSDWIESLKNEVCISPKIVNSKSWALHRELKSLGDDDGQMKAPLLGNNKEAGFQTEGNPVCIKSSLGAIIQTSTPVETLGHEEEHNQMQNPTVPLGLEVPNPSKIKLIGNSVLGSKSDGPKCINSSENQSKSCILFLENTETGSVGASSLSHERGLSLSSEIRKEAIPPSTGSHENGGGLCFSGSMEMQLSEVGSHCENASNFLRQNGEPMHDLQTEIGGSENCGLDQNTCKESLSTCPEERGGSNVMNETESSECSQIDNLLERSCKRSRSSENEGLQSKRQSLRSAKPLASEVLPRRSKRLVSKFLCFLCIFFLIICDIVEGSELYSFLVNQNIAFK